MRFVRVSSPGILHGAGLWQLPRQLYLPTEKKSAQFPNSHLKYVWYESPMGPWVTGGTCVLASALLGASPGSAARSPRLRRLVLRTLQGSFPPLKTHEPGDKFDLGATRGRQPGLRYCLTEPAEVWRCHQAEDGLLPFEGRGRLPFRKVTFGSRAVKSRR